MGEAHGIGLAPHSPPGRGFNGAVLLDIDPLWEMVLEGLLIALVVYLDNLQKRRQAGF